MRADLSVFLCVGVSVCLYLSLSLSLLNRVPPFFAFALARLAFGLLQKVVSLGPSSNCVGREHRHPDVVDADGADASAPAHGLQGTSDGMPRE